MVAAVNGKVIYFLSVLFLALAWRAPTLSAEEAGADPLKKLKADYQQIVEGYPEKQSQMLEKMLSDYLLSARQRYEDERAASNLKGMGVAKIAVGTLEDAAKQVAESGNFSFPDNIRPELKDYFGQIEQSRDSILESMKSRGERLRRNTFSQFAKIYRRQALDASDEEVIAAFEDWIEPGDEKKTEQEDAGAKTEDKPRIRASEIGLDLFNDKFATLKQGYSENMARLEDYRSKALDKFLADEAEQARERYEQQKRIRNVKGMAVAGKLNTLLQEMSAKLDESGQIEFPEASEQREELREYLSQLQGRMDAALKPFDDKKREIDAVGLERFKLLAREQVSDIDDQSAATVFEDWIADKYKPAVADKQAPGAQGAEQIGAGEGAADRLYFAESGSAREWFVVGSWQVDSKAMDIFTVPIYSGADQSGTKRNIMASTSAQWRYMHENNLEKRRYYAFRLKTVNGLKPPTVVAWPSQRNDWSIEVRTGNAAGQYGFVVEAGATVGPDGRELALETFDIPVVTEPSAARIYVDGERQYPPGSESVTPMTLALKKGVYDIEIRKEDHLTKRIKQFRVVAGARLDVKLKHESELPGERIVYTARDSWFRSKVKVEKGDKIWVVVSGKWTVGRQGEAVGPQGYPREEYPHYYSGEMRKFSAANYGALLMKVGEDYYGAPADIEDKRAVAVPGRVGVTATTWGELWFDVNEIESNDLRRDNRGALTLNVVVIPGGEAPIDE
jgi:hypothetical protein